MKIATVEEVQNLDKKCIEEYGISQEILMENAALSTLNLLKRKYSSIFDREILIICGNGNNGGDGLALARLLYSEGANIKICIIGNENSYKGAAKINYEINKKLNLTFIKSDNIEIEIKKTEIIIDAIFGVGLNRNINGKYKEIIELINENNDKEIISLDIPSGVNGNTGNIMGCAVNSSYTVSFGFLKYGNILYPGFKNNGELHYSKISFPPFLQSKLSGNINFPIKLPERDEDSHKGTYGKVAFLCGSGNYLGAPYFSSMAFLKSGGGYSRLITVKSIVNSLAVNAPEVVYYPMEETEEISISYDNKNEIKKILMDMNFVVIGCGLSLNSETEKLILELIKEIDIQILLDADALTMIAKDLNILKKQKNPVILTPHIGEMSKLCKLSIDEIKKNPLNIVKKFSKENNCIVVLKGPHSQIFYPNGEVFINISGNSVLATAGSGDILCGIIAAQYTLGYDIEEAVRMGVFLHGFCGDMLKEEKSNDGIIARDILNILPKSLKKIRKNFDLIQNNYKCFLK